MALNVLHNVGHVQSPDPKEPNNYWLGTFDMSSDRKRMAFYCTKSTEYLALYCDIPKDVAKYLSTGTDYTLFVLAACVNSWKTEFYGKPIVIFCSDRQAVDIVNSGNNNNKLVKFITETKNKCSKYFDIGYSTNKSPLLQPLLQNNINEFDNMQTNMVKQHKLSLTSGKKACSLGTEVLRALEPTREEREKQRREQEQRESAGQASQQQQQNQEQRYEEQHPGREPTKEEIEEAERMMKQFNQGGGFPGGMGSMGAMGAGGMGFPGQGASPMNMGMNPGMMGSQGGPQQPMGNMGIGMGMMGGFGGPQQSMGNMGMGMGMPGMSGMQGMAPGQPGFQQPGMGMGFGGQPMPGQFPGNTFGGPGQGGMF